MYFTLLYLTRLCLTSPYLLFPPPARAVVAEASIEDSCDRDAMGYAYAKLAWPVKLSAGKAYRITTMEFADSGDPWYEPTNGSAAEQFNGSVLDIDGGCYNHGLVVAFPSSVTGQSRVLGVPTLFVAAAARQHLPLQRLSRAR